MTLAYHPEFQPTIRGWVDWMDPARPVDARYDGFGVVASLGTAPRADWLAVNCIVPHYTAAINLIDGDPGELPEHIPAYLRAIQRDYTKNRGYSIGYNWAVDWLGGVWRLRGWTLKNAANKFHNEHTMSILCLVDGADPTTLAADMSIRWLIDEAERLAQREVTIVGHGQLQNPFFPTGCPGLGVENKIASGVLSPRWTPPTPAPTSPPTKEVDVTTIYQPMDGGQMLDPAQFAVTGTFAEWISTGERSSALVLLGIAEHAGIAGIPPTQPEGLDRGFLKSFTLIGAAPIYAAGYGGPRTSPADFEKWVS